jgi:TolA-binding protein
MAEQQISRTPPATAALTNVVGDGFPDWLKNKYIRWGGLAIVVVGAAIWFFAESGRRKEAYAADALDQARSALDSNNLPQASSELQKVIQNYSGTTAALDATLALNQVRMISGQNQLAADELKKFLATKPPAFHESAAASLLGAALENLGKPADAATAYQQAAESAKEPFRKVDALLAQAHALEAAGKSKEAVDVLTTIVKKYPDTPGNAEAQVRLSELTKGAI